MRSAPDLSLLREAFLWATMKGTSEESGEDEREPWSKEAREDDRNGGGTEIHFKYIFNPS